MMDNGIVADASLWKLALEAMDDAVSQEYIDLKKACYADSETSLQELGVSIFVIWMASHEVDQKYLGQLAATTSHDNPFLSSMLYKILGLSVLLSKKLVRARKLRRLDPMRETKSLQLYYHIVWLSREGLVIVEQYILPMVQDYILLKVLAYKLRASFYHIFVLFHNQPAIHMPGISSLPSSSNLRNGISRAPAADTSDLNRESISKTPPPSEGGPVRLPDKNHSHNGPPGLAPIPQPQPAASFLLPALDYTLTATPCFRHAAALADTLLPGSHPLRLSVKLEYAAYLYDCLHDTDACRRLAKQTIADVYNAQEGMDDESFEDAAELVAILGRMVKRGGKTSSAGGSSIDRSRSNDDQSTTKGTPPGQKLHTPSRRSTPTRQKTPSQQQLASTPTGKKYSPTSPQTKGKPVSKQSPSAASGGSTTPKAPVPIINPI